MKEYETPYCDVTLIDNKDIITTSGDSPIGDADDWLEI